MSEIVRLTQKYRSQAIAVLVETFNDYPAMRECFFHHAADEQEYQRWLSLFMGLIFDQPFYLDGPLVGIVKNETLVAVMCCWKPGMNLDEKTWPEQLQQTYATWVNAVGEEGIRKLELYSETSDQHQPSGPHYFVDCIGVLDNHRGNGYAKTLLQYCCYLSNSDPGSTGVALETEAARNVEFYRQLGYELKGESDIEGMQCWHFFKPND